MTVHDIETKFENSKLVNRVAILLQVFIFGLPIAFCVLPFYYVQSITIKFILLVITPFEYALLFGIIAGLFSQPFQKGIIKGVFPRKTGHPIYAMRKLYGACWTSLYYFKPVYSIILGIDIFRAITFRLFGYKGSLNFVIYPDTWVRDLPLLRIEDGVYIANRATVGTNICLINGNILVGNITLKKGSVLGHLSIFGIGATLGERSEIGLDVAIGLHTKIGNDCTIGTTSVISHKVSIGNNSHIGVCSFIGTGATIGDNLTLPSNTSIPDGAEVYTMEDVMKYVKSKPPVPQYPFSQSTSTEPKIA